LLLLQVGRRWQRLQAVTTPAAIHQAGLLVTPCPRLSRMVPMQPAIAAAGAAAGGTAGIAIGQALAQAFLVFVKVVLLCTAAACAGCVLAILPQQRQDAVNVANSFKSSTAGSRHRNSLHACDCTDCKFTDV
jgi:hypothetical protein